jgi:hypothetical protein
MRCYRRWIVLGLLLAAVPGSAQTMPMPVDIQLPLFLKILTYDRSFQYKARSAITIGVVYLPGDAESVKAKDEMVANLQRLTDRTIKNLPIKYVTLEFKDVASLDRAVKAGKVNVFYVAPGLGDQLPHLLKMARSYAITTATGVPEFVQRGISVGIGMKADKKPDILINLPASRSEGSEFDASLLRIATVVK